MKISKHIHSCLLIEEKGITILIDPGSYTAESRALDIRYLKKLDYVLITHEHQDHVFVPFLKDIAVQFPNLEIISNKGVAFLLEKEGLKVSLEGNEFISFQDSPHEKLLPSHLAPQNTVFTLFGKVTHPGDSLNFKKTAEVLALPIQAPWGSMVQAVEKAIVLKPKIVIPIHDWHWREEARKKLHEAAAKELRGHGIALRSLEDDEVLEL